MSTLVIKRLVWKEARTLLPIWGALLIAVAGLQLAFVVGGYVTDDGVVGPPGSDVFSWRTLCAVAGPLAFCFAAASAGILFAGETEERTDDWLRVLPIPPGLLTACKLGMAVVALALFVAIGTASGLLLTALFAQSHQLLELREVGVGAIIGMTILYGLLALVTGLFLSVRMKRVVSVVAGSLILTLPLLGLSDWFVKDILRIQSEAGSPTVFTLLGLLDVWLVWRWCRGESVALPGPAAWLESISGWLTPSQSFSVARLRQATAIGHPWTRAFAVQVWREVRSALPFTLVWGAMGLFFLLPTALANLKSFPIEVGSIFAMLYWAATPGVTGLMAAGSERRNGQVLFAGQRGVSTSATWLAKQLVWMSLAAVLTVCWTAAQHGLAETDASKLGQGRFDASIFTALVDRNHWLETPGYSSHAQRTAADAALARNYLLSLGLSLYAIGQLCGFWFRNLFVGGAVALFLSFPIALWHRAVVMQDVPIWMACGPLTALWMFATWRLLDDWQTGRFDHGLRWRRLAWLAGPAIIAMAMFSYARATQIPDVEFPKWLEMDLSKTPAVPEFSAAEIQEWEDWTDELRQYVDFRVVHSDSTGRRHKERPPGVAAPDPGPLDSRLQRLVSDLRSGRPDVLPNSTWTSHVGVSDLGRYARTRASELSHAGEPERAARMCVDALCILRYAARQQPAAIQPAMLARRSLFVLLAEWTRQEDRTPDELRRLFNDKDLVSETTVGWWTSPPVIAHQYANSVRDLLDQRGTEFNQFKARMTAENPQAHWALRLLPWFDWVSGNHERTRRLLKVLTINAANIALWNRQPIYFEENTRAEIERWVSTTRILGVSYSRGYLRYPQLRIQDDFLADQIDIASQNGLRLLIAMEIHRLEQGAYPESLSALVPEFFHALPIDPFTGADYEYLPSGLDAAWLLDARNVASTNDFRRRLLSQSPEMVEFYYTNRDGLTVLDSKLRVIPAGQPLLFSRGPRDGDRVFQSTGAMTATQPEYDKAKADNALPTGVYREVSGGFIDGGGDAARTWPLSLGMLRATDDAPTAFVVLGCDFQPWGIDVVTARSDVAPPADLPDGD